MKNIFISSTFRDMQAERDMVQKDVVPVLREKARSFGDNVGVIDLRWGVDTSTLEKDEGSMKVLSVCLNEIERSHPYMLIFLGERYGWIPEKGIIQKAVKHHQDKYVPEDLEKSVTALEIEFGALSEQYGQLENCIVCFREPIKNLSENSDRKIYQEENEKGIQKLAALKEKIEQKLGDRVIYYTAEWDATTYSLIEFKSEGKPLSEVLIERYIELFQEEWKKYEKISWQEKEQLFFTSLVEKETNSFVGREGLLEKYYQKLICGDKTVVLQGETGCGKTAIMCKLADRMKKEGKQVFFFSAGSGNRSYSAELLIRQMIFYFESFLKISESDTDGLEKYEVLVDRLLCISEKIVNQKIYLLLDGLEQIYGNEIVDVILLFAENANIQMILSGTKSLVLPHRLLAELDVEEVPKLAVNEAKNMIVGMLESNSRNAYEDILQEMLEKETIYNPLYVSILIQRLNMMDAEELYDAQIEQEIIDLGVKVIREIPNGLKDALSYMFDTAIKKVTDHPQKVKEIINYFAMSRRGLRLNDVRWMVSDFSSLDISRVMKYLDTFFYILEDERIDFSHSIIREALREKIENKEDYDQELGNYMLNTESDVLTIRESIFYAKKFKKYVRAQMIIEDTYSLDSEEVYSFYKKNTKREKLVKREDIFTAIREEALSDEGQFYCEMIDEFDTDLYDTMLEMFFQERLPQLFGTSEKEIRTLSNIQAMILSVAEPLWNYHEDTRWPSIEVRISSNRNLYLGFRNMGDYILIQGDAQKAYGAYQKSLEYLHEFFSLNNGETFHSRLRMYAEIYNRLGRTQFALIKNKGCITENTTNYLQHALDAMEKAYTEKSSLENLELLADCYTNIGDACLLLRQKADAKLAYKNALKCANVMNDNLYSMHNQLKLAYIYERFATSLILESDRWDEAMEYYKSGLELAKRVNKVKGSLQSFKGMIQLYNNMGTAYFMKGRTDEAKNMFEHIINYQIALNDMQHSLQSLSNLGISFMRMRLLCMEEGNLEKAVEYQMKEIECDELTHMQLQSQESFWEVLKGYKRIEKILAFLGREEETEKYFQKEYRLCGQICTFENETQEQMPLVFLSEKFV